MNDPKPFDATPLNLPIVFILAKGRSGTTLLQTMLDAHSETVAPLESRFAVHFSNRYQKITRWTPKLKQRFLTDVLNEMKIAYFWELNISALEKRIEAVPENSSYGLLCKQVYLSHQSFFQKAAPKVIIDKNPIHALMIPILLKIFPDATFVHMVRDFRANSSSFYKFHPQKTMRELGYMWLIYNQKIEVLKSKMPERIHFLRYEDLLVNTESELSSLVAHFGLEYEENMLQYHKQIGKAYEQYIERSPSEAIKNLRELGAKAVHKNLSKPLNPQLMETWKKSLTAHQIDILNRICGKYAKRYRYTTEGDVPLTKQPPIDIRLKAEKLCWYYSMPIWLRELKSKPNLALLPKK